MPYFDINIDDISNNINEYVKDVVKGLNKWKEMKEKRENLEIPIQEYIDWKLNFRLESEIQWFSITFRITSVV